ncbi:NADP-dependent phosphogluconate dehydrogenase, partial [Azospirillum brasilense]|nr:NADP-dependent phosphogluconate dehydrogenase [Azospirillum brasilense]
ICVTGPSPHFPPTESWVASVRAALVRGWIACLAQAFAGSAGGSRRFRWDVYLAPVARFWRGGCIIRARLLDRILTALNRAPELPNLMLDPDIAGLMTHGDAGFRRVVAAATLAAVPVPAMASALSYWDGYRSGRLWANMIQAQRDYFGAHGYERTDRPGMVHTEWKGA